MPHQVNDYAVRARGSDAYYRAASRHDGYFTQMLLLLLTTSGARTGQPHLTPLAYLDSGDRYVVVAANAGAPRHPDWYYNLIAHPRATVVISNEDLAVRAVVHASGQQRDSLFERFAAACPQVMLYQASTSRQFPVITLIPR